MTKITLGRQGNQPFEITQPGVSRRHAEIEITDDGVWVLRDLDPENSNGTFIRDDNGEWQRISTINITDKTFICLGPDNSNGCSFYAEQVLNPGKFTKEFAYLNEIEDKFDYQLERASRITRTARVITALASLIGLVGSFMIPPDYPDLRLNFIRMGSAVSALCTLLIDPSKKIKSIQAKRDKFHRCPNPRCSHTLRSAEIRDMQCAKCKCK